jgi:predicted ATPase
VVRELLERIPSLTCLVTSRHRLLLAGEQEFPLRPLPTPAPPDITRERVPERLMEFASVQLFVDRARAATLDFRITPENAEAVARLCHWLEGIPLAIELAAARAGVLTPGQMLEQIADRFDFLVSRRRDIADRHRTLRAALDWSYRMLLPDLQAFFSRLSVFRGGWTAEAAEAVTGESEVLDCLEYLRDFSLVLTAEVAAAIRFRFLETLREFAWEQLGEAERQQLSQRHADYFLGVFCPAAEAGLSGSEQEPRWLRRLEAEQENLRAALEWRACCQDSAGGDSTEADAARARALLEALRLRQQEKENRTTAGAAPE